MRNTSYMKKLVQTDPYIDTPEEQESGSPTAEASNKIKPAPPTVTAQDPSLSSGATGIPLLLGLFVLDSLPPGWKTLCVLSSYMFLTLSRVNTYVCFKRHSTMQLDTWTLAVRYYKAYYYVEGYVGYREWRFRHVIGCKTICFVSSAIL